MAMRPVPIPLGSNPARSRQAGDTRVINGFLEAVADSPKAKYAIYAFPGLTRWVDIGGGLCRGMVEVDDLFVVSGSQVIKVQANGTVTNIGIVPGDDRVIFASNAADPRQIAIASGGNVYIATSSRVDLLYLPDILTGVVSVDWLDGYFIIALSDGRFFITGLNDTTIDPLDFATAEGDPDGLVRGFVHGRELFLMGPKTIEVWSNTGASTFPFSRLQGAVIKHGLGARHSVCDVAGVMYFVDEKGIVRRIGGGYQPQKVSNDEIDRIIQGLGDFSGLAAFSYTDKGHEYYVLTSSTQGKEFTWLYDQSTGMWTERRTGTSKRWQANSAVWFNNGFIVGSATEPALFRMSDSALDEDGTPIIWSVRFPIVDAFPIGAIVHAFDVDVETGVGVEGGFEGELITFDMISILWDSDKFTLDQTQDLHGDFPDVAGKYPDKMPRLMLRWSDDGSKSWSAGLYREMGRQAKVQRIQFGRLGGFGRSGRTFEISCSANVARALFGASITAKPRDA